MAITIHEFSTGIRPDQTPDGGWVSRGFTSRFMNSTVDPIPHEIERSIANFDFSITEGTARDEPAFIGRIIASQDQQSLWSVVAIVSRGKDEVGRSAPFFRYFFVEGGPREDFIPHILAWFEQYKSSYGQYPIFNPFDQRTIGNGLKVDIIPKSLQQMTSPLLYEPTPMIFNEYNAAAIHELSVKKVANQQNILAAWAYNVEAVERPGQFTAIRAASEASYNALSNAKKAMVGIQPRVVFDEESVKTALKGITNSPTIKDEHFQDFATALADQKVASQWPRIFNGLGAKNALDRGIYNSQMIKLLILQSVAIPSSAIGYVKWLSKSDQKSQGVAKFFEEDLSDKIDKLSNLDLVEQIKDKLVNGFSVFTANLMSDKVALENLFSKGRVHSLWLEQSQAFIEALISDLNLMGQCFQSPSQANVQRVPPRTANKTAPIRPTTTDNYHAGMMVAPKNTSVGRKPLLQPTAEERQEAYSSTDFALKDEEWKKIRHDIWKFWNSGRSNDYLKPEYLSFAEVCEKNDYKIVAVVFYDLAQKKIPRGLYNKFRSRHIFGMPLHTDKTLREKMEEVQNILSSSLRKDVFFYHNKNSGESLVRKPFVIILMLLSMFFSDFGKNTIKYFFSSEPITPPQPTSNSTPVQDTANKNTPINEKVEQIAILINSLVVSSRQISKAQPTKKGCTDSEIGSFLKKIDISDPEKDLKDICEIIKKHEEVSDQQVLKEHIQTSLGRKNNMTAQWEDLKKKITEKQRKISQINSNDPKTKTTIDKVKATFQEVDRKIIDINPEIYELMKGKVPPLQNPPKTEKDASPRTQQ
jgi:hypothetical protein